MTGIVEWSAMDRAISDAESLFEQCSIARAEAENADERRKQIRALMFIKFRDEGKAIGEASERAMSTPEYKAAADDWMSANITWRTLEGKARGKELRFEAWRSANSMKKAQMGLR